MKVKDLYLLPISQKGQVTIPVQIRQMLDLDSSNQVIFEVEDKKKVLLKPNRLTLRDVYGAVKPIKKSFSQIRKIARQERVLAKNRKNK